MKPARPANLHIESKGGVVMTAQELLNALEGSGALVSHRGGRLKIEAPAGVVTHTVRYQLEHHKDEIVALISERDKLDQARSWAVEPEPIARSQAERELEARAETLFEELGRSPGVGMEYKREGHPAHEIWLEFQRCWRDLQEVRGKSKDQAEDLSGRS